MFANNIYWNFIIVDFEYNIKTTLLLTRYIIEKILTFETKKFEKRNNIINLV